jgi:hypothetical protein
MSALELVQRAVMRAIALGPDHMPDGLLEGSRDRALRGLSVHANTISHARLVALEETFPRTRRHLGDAAFNGISRGFCDGGQAGAAPFAQIGRDFPAWLAASGQPGTVTTLARFEWAWLDCHHAREAAAFDVAALASLGEAGIASLVLVPHPASIVVSLDSACRRIIGDEFGTPFETPHILISRPEAEVEVTAISATAARLHAALVRPVAICNLLAEAPEPDAEAGLLALIAAGALVRTVEDCVPC